MTSQNEINSSIIQQQKKQKFFYILVFFCNVFRVRFEYFSFFLSLSRNFFVGKKGNKHTRTHTNSIQFNNNSLFNKKKTILN